MGLRTWDVDGGMLVGTLGEGVSLPIRKRQRRGKVGIQATIIPKFASVPLQMSVAMSQVWSVATFSQL